MLDHILIVDESRLVREALAKILLSCGINKSAIACIENMEDAVELAQFSPVELLVCSNNFSHQSPAQLRTKLQKISNNTNLPLLELSHLPPSENNVITRPEHHITLHKPFKQQQVLNALFTLTGSEKFSLANTQAPADDETEMRVSHIASASEKNKQGDTSKPTILVVDDESSNIDVAAGNLRQHYRVIAAKSGEYALKIINNDKHNIELILLDIMMPQMDGYQVCAALKENAKTAHIPIIFLSAKTQVADIKYGFDLGAVDYITKPLNGDLLRARVATHIHLQQQKSALAEQVITLRENAKLREDIEKITHHDLKGPLNNILFETFRLQDKTAAKSINKAVNNVVNMINNSLNLYKIEQGIYKITPEKMNLNKMVIDAINAVSQLSEDKSLDITLSGFSEEKYVLGEPLLCLSIFNNLVKNAVEASNSHEPLQVTLSNESGYVSFKIINQGVIPTNLRATLFDKYSSSNHQSGTGLGTYSAKLMTEVQHGEVYFDIIDEQQTMFVVKLPCA